MSGLSGSIPPRSRPVPDRPPVDSWTIIPGQCLLRPSNRRPNLSGSEVGLPASSRTWQCARVAPASNASWVDSICSLIVIGTAGLSAFVGNDPVIATVMIQGAVIRFALSVLGRTIVLFYNTHGEDVSRLPLSAISARCSTSKFAEQLASLSRDV